MIVRLIVSEQHVEISKSPEKMTCFSPLPQQRLQVGYRNFACWQSLRCSTYVTITPKLYLQQLRRLLGKFAQKLDFRRKNPSLAAVTMATGMTKIWKLDTMVDIMTAYNMLPYSVPTSLISRPLLCKNDDFQTKSPFRSDSPISEGHIPKTVGARKNLMRLCGLEMT